VEEQPFTVDRLEW